MGFFKQGTRIMSDRRVEKKEKGGIRLQGEGRVRLAYRCYDGRRRLLDVTDRVRGTRWDVGATLLVFRKHGCKVGRLVGCCRSGIVWRWVFRFDES